MDVKVVTLTEPVKHGDEEVTKLEFRRGPKAKDMKGIPVGVTLEGDHLITLVARLTGYPPSVIGEIELVDLMECGRAVGDFLSRGPQTGSGPVG